MASTAQQRRAQPPPTTAPTTAKMVARRSPFLPTALETGLLSIYPAILFLGSVFSVIDPSARHSTYDPILQSHPAATAPSYFAKKSNLFNQLFVKKGWLWVTLSYFFFLFTHPSTGPPRSLVLTSRRLRGISRYGIVTVWWIFITQWFFGPPIIDRGFLLSGGQCEMVKMADQGMVDMDDTRQFLTGVACKSVGGTWSGGHDISGHVFLLVLGSMFLLQEVLHVVLRSLSVREERTILMADGAVKGAEVESEKGVNEGDGVGLDLGVKIALGVAGLSLFMLSMTAIYFHTWFEKFTGLLVALMGVFLVYFLPRWLVVMRQVVGMPGV